MVKKGFPKFGMSQAGAYVTALKNYNLPDFILKLVAKDTDSELCLLYTSPSPRDLSTSRMPSSA